jgi:peptidyl-prolyl cis-trans isomerase C
MNSTVVSRQRYLDVRPARASLLRRIAREPLVHFALIGAAIFVLAHQVEARRRAAEATIVVDAALQDRLARLFHTQFGVAPTAQQLAIVTDEYVDDEVLYREAQRIGLGDDDEIVRRRLIQKMEFLQRDSATPMDASAATLRSYYDAHPELFSVGTRVSFSQLYFSADRGGDAAALERARDARVRLLAGERVVGDDVSLDPDYSSLTRAEAERVLGATPAVDALFSSPAGDWSEPVRSGLGWHLLRITAVQPPRVLPFDEVLPDVRAAYLQEATSRARRARFDSLRARYHVAARVTAE